MKDETKEFERMFSKFEDREKLALLYKHNAEFRKTFSDFVYKRTQLLDEAQKELDLIKQI